MRTNPPPIQVWPNCVRLSGPALVEVYGCIVAGIDRAKRSARSTERLEVLRRALHDAMSASGQFDVAKIVESPAVQEDRTCGEAAESGTEAAATLAGVDQRTMRRWAAAGLGRRVGGVWLVDNSRLAALLEERKTRHGD